MKTEQQITARGTAMPAWRLSVAPMMDWTDRHCRYLHRLFSRKTLLYTEMVTADAVLHGDARRLLDHDPAEHPLALQLGGSDPDALAAATGLAVQMGFDEINLNVGCPSDRVQSGRFGAVLMKEPALVADCARAMIAAAGPVPVTVKCRIGVDDQEPREVLPRFLETVSGSGVKRFAIHARKAWLQGLSPKENRTVPPLNHALVVEMKRAFPGLRIVINGGIDSLDQAQEFLDRGLDGVMIGRAAYQRPTDILAAADPRIFGTGQVADPVAVARAMLPHIERHLQAGGQLHQITRHMLGLFAGRPGARQWRRILSEQAHRPGAGPEVVEQALQAVGAPRPVTA